LLLVNNNKDRYFLIYTEFEYLFIYFYYFGSHTLYTLHLVISFSLAENTEFASEVKQLHANVRQIFNILESCNQ